MTQRQDEEDSRGRELGGIYMFKANARWGASQNFRGEEKVISAARKIQRVLLLAHTFHHQAKV